MYKYVIWFAGLLFEAVLLARAFPTRLYARLPIFYLYVFVVLASSAALFFVYRKNFYAYTTQFWFWEFLTLLLGYGVVLEVMHHAFKDYPGAERLARYLGFIAFGLVFIAVGIGAWLDRLPVKITSMGTRVDGLERDLRVVESIFLFIIAVVVLHYGIELGKNVEGLAIGMGIYVAVSIVMQALSVVYGEQPKFQSFFEVAQPTAYTVTLGVWTAALWSYAPAKSAPPNAEFEADYQAFVAKTKEKLKALRSNFTPMTGLW
jgi:hypothetical protein